jgi:hypothetical protein
MDVSPLKLATMIVLNCIAFVAEAKADYASLPATVNVSKVMTFSHATCLNVHDR